MWLERKGLTKIHASVLLTLEIKIYIQQTWLLGKVFIFFLFTFFPIILKIWNLSILWVNYFGKSIKYSVEYFLARNIMELWAI